MSLAGSLLATLRSVRLEAWRAPDVFDAADDHALWQHAEQASPAATFKVSLSPASPARLTISLSS